MPEWPRPLARVPLFANLPEKTINRLERVAVSRVFAQGALIVTEGEVGTGFYLITEGSVAVERGAGETLLATFKTGDYFGDMAMLDGRPRSASVRAMEPTSCLVISRWDFIAEVRSNPDLALDLLEVLSLRVRDLEARLDGHV